VHQPLTPSEQDEYDSLTKRMKVIAPVIGDRQVPANRALMPSTQPD